MSALGFDLGFGNGDWLPAAATSGQDKKTDPSKYRRPKKSG